LDEKLINPEGLKILTEIECEYMSALMRKKSKTLLNEDNLNHLFTDGKTTIEQLGNILIKSDVSNQVLFTKYS